MRLRMSVTKSARTHTAGGVRRALRPACAVALLLVACCAPGCVRRVTDEEVAKARGINVNIVVRLRNRRALSSDIVLRLKEEDLRSEILAAESGELPEVNSAYGTAPDDAAARQAPTPAVAVTPEQSAAGVTQATPPPDSAILDSRAPSLAEARANAARWEPMGPDNLGGRTRSIVIDPANAQRMWVGSAGGGVWLTDDGGRSYHALDDQMASLVVSCMVLSPTEPGTIYAGTGEDFFRTVRGPRGAGVLKIKEDGSWRQLKGTGGEDFEYVNRLAVSPDGKVLLAATSNGLRRTTDEESGVWETFPDISFRMSEVLFDPRDGSKAVAGGLDHGEVFFSDDGGKSWRAGEHQGVEWSGRVALTYARADSSIVYASIERSGPEVADGPMGEVWVSKDGGRSYEKKSSLDAASSEGKPASYLGLQGRYDNLVWAGDPKDAKIVVVGGLDLWRSADGGDTLTQIGDSHHPKDLQLAAGADTHLNLMHEDQHCVVSDPNYDGVNNKRVFVCNDGGVYKTEDIKAAGLDVQSGAGLWIPLNNTYAVTQFQGGSGNPATSALLGGTQDNGTLLLMPGTGPDQWAEVGHETGDGGYCAFDASDGIIFGESPRMQIFRSLDGGKTHEYIYGIFFCANGGTCCIPAFCETELKFCCKQNPFLIEEAGIRGKANFIAPFIVDPNDSRRILVGGLSLWRTRNADEQVTDVAGPQWAAIKDPQPSPSPVPISAIAVAAGDPNTVWVGHNNGDIFKTGSGDSDHPNDTWQRVDENGPQHLPERLCSRITIVPGDAGAVYASFGEYAADNLWKSTDGGASWRPVSEGLPPVPVFSLAVHPRDATRLYVGTARGVFASADGGNHWKPFGPTSSAVEELFWLGDTLVAATYGRGMFKIDLHV